MTPTWPWCTETQNKGIWAMSSILDFKLEHEHNYFVRTDRLFRVELEKVLIFLIVMCAIEKFLLFFLETGKKHRKHRAPVCIAGKTTDDITLLRGKKAGNFTNIGDVGDFGMCIKRCCQQKNCDLAFKSSETCFLVSCFSKESCKTSPSLDDIFSPRMCFVRRHLLQSERGNE